MDELATDVNGGVSQAITERVAGGEGALSAREAALSLVDTRRKEQAAATGQAEQQQETPAEARTDATAEHQESTSQEDDAARESDPGETTEQDRASEEPPIDAPRSWTKEDKELFKGLPRATQERLVERERSRESDFLKRQNAAAEQLKGLTAKEAAAEQVRSQYEQALPMLLQALQEQHQGEFADIKSIADVEKMAREDWPRYVLWDAQQKKVAAVRQEVQAAQQRQQQEKAQRWQTFAADEDAKFAEKAPELADKDAKSKAATGAAEMLRDLGFSDGELADLWNGAKEVSLRDHRLQLLIRDGVKYREAQAAAKKPAPKPVPQVQRPGTQPVRSADADGRVKDLTERLNATGNVRDAAALLAARRAAQRR